MLNSIMKLLSALISIYTLLIIIRIMSSWLQGPGGRNLSIGPLARITDPYLNWFRRFPFLMVGNLDFSPIVGLVVLSVAGNVFNALAAFGRVSLGLILGLLVSQLWSALAFILFLYILLIALRAFSIILQLNPASSLWRTLDMIIHPVYSRITEKLLGGSQGGTYLRNLLFVDLVLFFLRISGNFLVARLAILLRKLPF